MRFRLKDYIQHEAWHFAAMTAIVAISVCFQVYNSVLNQQRESVLSEIKDLERVQFESSRASFSAAELRSRDQLMSGDVLDPRRAKKSLDAISRRISQHEYSSATQIKATQSAIEDFSSRLNSKQVDNLENSAQRLSSVIERHLAATESTLAELEFKLIRTGWTYFFLLVTLLFLESAFFFRPLILSFRESHRLLLEESAIRQQASAELEETKNELETRNAELTAKADQMASLIEEQKVGFDLLKVAHNRFQELFHGIPFPCFSIDADHKVFDWNHECELVFEQPAFMITERNIFDFLVTPEDSELLEMVLVDVLQGAIVRKQNMRFLTSKGEVRSMLVSLFPVRGANGAITGALVASVDLTKENNLQHQIEDQLIQIGEINIRLEFQKIELEAANNRLEALATTDGLTGLKNHRAFREFLQVALDQYEQSGEPVSLCLLDVDFFKKFNDSFGHQAGDEVLRGVANCLREGGGESGCVARYGGEEFVVVLPGLGATEAVGVADFLRSFIAGQEWPHRQVTASFGVATLRVGTLSQNELIEMADQALYHSKERGRNCVTHFQDIDAKDLESAA